MLAAMSESSPARSSMPYARRPIDFYMLPPTFSDPSPLLAPQAGARVSAVSVDSHICDALAG